MELGTLLILIYPGGPIQSVRFSLARLLMASTEAIM